MEGQIEALLKELEAEKRHKGSAGWSARRRALITGTAAILVVVAFFIGRAWSRGRRGPVIGLAPNVTLKATGAIAERDAGRPRACSVHVEAKATKTKGSPCFVPGARAYAFYDGAAAGKGPVLLADDFVQKPAGREFEATHLTIGDSTTFVRDLVVQLPTWVPRDGHVVVAVEVAVLEAGRSFDSMACPAPNQTLGVCSIAKDERGRGVCDATVCVAVDLRTDEAGEEVQGVESAEVSLRVSDC